jgi:hypothetical protein
MKHTAVEWLQEKFTNSNADFINWAEEYFEQAKEIEKQQIIDAYDVTWDANIKDGKDYYNQKFKK